MLVGGGGGGLKSFSWQTQLLSWVVVELGLWKYPFQGEQDWNVVLFTFEHPVTWFFFIVIIMWFG